MDTPMKVSGTSQPSEVAVQMSISCGCGFLAQTLREAVRHVEVSGHVMSAHGQIGRHERLSRVRVEEVRK